MVDDTSKYEIVARLLAGPITIGYKLFRNDKFHSVSTEKTMELIENGSISNGKVIDIGNSKAISIDKSIGSIQANNQVYVPLYRVVRRKEDNRTELVSIICRDTANKEVKISASKFWSLALEEKIKGVKARVCYNSKKELQRYVDSDNLVGLPVKDIK